MMKITEVRIFLKNEERLKAYASITFDDAFVVRNLKVIAGKKGLFVSMPNRKTKDGEYKDVAHPVNNEMRDSIESQVLEAYNKKLAENPVLSSENAEDNDSYETVKPAVEQSPVKKEESKFGEFI